MSERRTTAVAAEVEITPAADQRRTTAVAAEVEITPAADQRRTTAVVLEIEVQPLQPPGLPGVEAAQPEAVVAVQMAPARGVAPSPPAAMPARGAVAARPPAAPSRGVIPARPAAPPAQRIVLSRRPIAARPAMPAPVAAKPGVEIDRLGGKRAVRLPELLNLIKPYVVGWSQSVAASAVDTLGFLKTDGTRELAGSMDVADGVTVDGVDIDGAQKLDILRW